MLTLSAVLYNSIAFDANTVVIVDPGYSFISGPLKTIISMYDQISKQTICRANDATIPFSCSCTDSTYFPSLVFVIDNVEYEIESKYYVNKVNSFCNIYIFPSNNGNWVLGQSFFRKFYSVWDYSIPAVGLTVAKISDTSGDSSNSSTFTDDWVIAVVVVVAAVLFVAIIWLGYVMYKKKYGNKNSTSVQASFLNLTSGEGFEFR